jgi:hypothetical protein
LIGGAILAGRGRRSFRPFTIHEAHVATEELGIAVQGGSAPATGGATVPIAPRIIDGGSRRAPGPAFRQRSRRLKTWHTIV